ncbi:MAG: hypothetical protein ED559_00430 [Phycisphaera sp.]|nr:MAG: hypothetical protein ED559_00430 [Phycisphaera sp.]
MMRQLILATTVSMFAGVSAAQAPNLGGAMLHILIEQDGDGLVLEYETPVSGPIELFLYPGEMYNGAASVLDETYYSGRYGWLANGFFNLPAGSGVFVENLGTTAGLGVYDAFSYAPILGTDGSSDIWQWSGQMTHNWYSATEPGVYSASYRVYVGNATTQEPLAGWEPAEIMLEWFVPFDCVADVNGDGMLSPTDFTAWINAYNNGDPQCDQNGDGACTPTDFTAWIANYNAGC